MSKQEHNGIYYDPHNEIVCDKLRLKELIDKVADLEAKLAEKDEEAQEIYEMYNQERKKNWLYNRKNQDKISFALDQLEKVKENIHYLLSFDYNLVFKVNEQIDNQIKQLKEMK